MSKLILSLDGKELKEYRLDKERILIGRKSLNDIEIDDVAVSGEHAVVITILNDSFLEDLGSTNGTKVNGNTVKRYFLQNNDVIGIGKYRLSYIHEPVPRPAPDFDKTVVLRPSAVSAMLPSSVSVPEEAPVENAPASPPPPPPRHAVATIQLLTGPSAGRELDLVKNLTTLGKPGVQVAVITRRPQGFYITHVDGAKPPVLNGNTIGLQPHPLRDHDIVELLGIKMEFFLK